MTQDCSTQASPAFCRLRSFMVSTAILGGIGVAFTAALGMGLMVITQ